MTINEARQVKDYYGSSNNELAQRYLKGELALGTQEYCEAALKHRYDLYPEIPRIADFAAFSGKDVLEVGVGQGADHCMFARSGANLSGIDLTAKHCHMAGQFLAAYGLHSNIVNADAARLPFADQSFDHVYSCGVLLLLANIEDAIAELHRVLRPGGSLTLMLYNKRSVHYWIKTRLYYGWLLGEDQAIGRQAVDDWYTDGPGYLRVYHYSPRDLKWLLRNFRDVAYQTSCLTPEQIPECGPPRHAQAKQWLADRFGFFLWGTGRKL